MSAEFFRVHIDPDGAFYSDCGPRGKRLFEVDGKPMTRSSVPSSSWPIVHSIEGAVEHLYFTYFLSSTVHKWRLTRTGGRETGMGGQAAEFLDTIEGADADTAWLLAKLSPAGLRLEEGLEAPRQEFAALEYSVARALVDGRLKDMVLARANAIAMQSGGADDSVDSRLFRCLRVPPGYRGAVPLGADGSRLTDDIWGHLQSPTFGLNLSAISDFSERVTAEINKVLTPTLIQLRYELDRHLHSQCCILCFDVDDESIDGYARTLRLVVGESLFAYDMPQAHSRAAIIARLRHSLVSLLPHLLRFLEIHDRNFALRFCFADSGAEGFISFDRYVSSDVPLIPDLYMLDYARVTNYLPMHDEAQFRRAFATKQQVLFWRGSTTGGASKTLADLYQNPRVRACVNIKEQLGKSADCKISRLFQVSFDADVAKAYLRDVDIFAQEVDESAFAQRQFYIDLPGNAAAWGTFRKFLCGCVVLRPEPVRRELAYYSVLEPGRDYVPVREDCSNVGEVVRKLLADPDNAAAIAYRGRAKIIQLIRDIQSNTIAGIVASLSEQH